MPCELNQRGLPGALGAEGIGEVLQHLIEDPGRAAHVALEDVPAILRDVCALEAAVGTAKMILASRIASPRILTAASEPEDDSDVVGLDDAMRITGRTEDWLRRHWRQYGLASQDTPGSRLRWSRKRCQQYHARHLVRPAA